MQLLHDNLLKLLLLATLDNENKMLPIAANLVGTFYDKFQAGGDRLVILPITQNFLLVTNVNYRCLELQSMH